MNRNLLIICMWIYAATTLIWASSADLPGVTRCTNNVYLVENHSSCFSIWHARNIKGATLVHIDAHEDCRYVAPDKLETLGRLTAERNYAEIFRQSDLEYSFRYQLKPDKSLFDIGNYIYPCIMDGTVSRYYWVVPEKTIDENKLVFLQEHLRAAYRTPSLVFSSMTNNSFSFMLSNCTIIVTTLDSLPQQEKGTLLDIDTDFFLFPCSLTESHIRGDLLWDPPTVCELLTSRVPAPSVITIAASVSGGYLPVAYRFLSDGLFGYYANGTYPTDAVNLLKVVTAMLSYHPIELPPPRPNDQVFLAACEHIAGLMLMAKGEEKTAVPLIENAARLNPAYSKALLDMAEAFLSMGKPKRAHAMIDKFEQLTTCETSHSSAARVRAYLVEKNLEKADKLSLKLVEWERSPVFLILRAGVLTEHGLLSEAIDIYREIVNKHSDNGTAFYNLGYALARQGKISEAVDNYRLAIRLKPDLAIAHENLGYILMSEGKLEEAVSHLNNAAALNPFNISTLNNLGLALTRQNRFKESITCYEAAIKLDPERPSIQANLALALINSGRISDGIERCKKALELKPDWPEVINLMNEAKRKSGYQESIR